MLQQNTVDFELGEDVRSAARQAQDARWKDAAQDARKQTSRREECIIYATELTAAIRTFRSVQELVQLMANPRSVISKLNLDVLGTIVEYTCHGQRSLLNLLRSRQEASFKRKSCKATVDPSFQIFVRKRPITSHEIAIGNYDIVDTDVSVNGDTTVIHNGQLARNGRRLSIQHKSYTFSRILNDKADNVEVCTVAVDPLIRHALQGNASTLLCYGQTGTGKTYTLMAALKHAASRFTCSNLEITFYEIHGKKCYDLLAERKEIHLRSDDNDYVHVRGIKTVVLESPRPDHIMNVFSMAMKLRTSEETERNPISSRSHAICTIRLLDSALGAGKMTFVDLAGSERNYETVQMSAAQHRESADINFSLMALKNCFRSYHAEMEKVLNQYTARFATSGTFEPQHIEPKLPEKKMDKREMTFTKTGSLYRASLLTRVLKECFVVPSLDQVNICGRHMTHVIATISPAAIDAQHTINTLDHVVLMDPCLQKLCTTVDIEVPKLGAALSTVPLQQWTSEQVNTWLATVDNGRFSHLAVPNNFTGADLLQLDENSLSTFFSGQLRQARQEQEGEAWTEEIESARHRNISRLLWSLLRREIDFNKSNYQT